MAERAAHLVDGVFGDLPVRPWVLTLPHRLRYALAYDQRLCRAVLAVFVRAVLGFARRCAAAQGVAGRGGAVTAIQRCGSALNTNVHVHILVAEGVFATRPDGAQRFVPVRPPTDLEVARLLAAVRRCLVRLARRHGLALDAAGGGDGDAQGTDPLALEEPVLAQIQGASVLGCIATGPRAGQRVLRLGTDPAAPLVSTAGPRHAQADGFDLHANVAVRAGDRRRLEHLCRYVLRPPLAQDALELTPAGAVLLRLRRPRRDGTRAIRFAPTELLEQLAAMIPRPRANLLIYHGAFAPRGCVRAARAMGRLDEPHDQARPSARDPHAPPPGPTAPAVATEATGGGEASRPFATDSAPTSVTSTGSEAPMSCRANAARGVVVVLISMLASVPAATPAAAVGTSFTYQGQLSVDGAPADGVCTLQFALFAAANGGSAFATAGPLAVTIDEGLFSVPLDFGAVFAGAERWLEISAACPGNATQVLAPRQPITAAP